MGTHSNRQMSTAVMNAAKINFACMNRDVGLFAVVIFGEFSSFL